MKTLLFREYQVGREGAQNLLSLERLAFESGVHLLVAPNGIGKSSFLQTVAHVLPARFGIAELDGAALRVERDVAYFPEYLAFPKYITALEWIEYHAGRGGQAGGTGFNGDRLKKDAERLRFQKMLDRPLGAMSQGERRKVNWIAIDAAVQNGRRVVLLDEPFNGLDLLAQPGARQLIQDWKALGCVVILVTHHASEFLEEASHVWFIQDRMIREFDLSLLPSVNRESAFRDHVLKIYREI